MQASQATPCDTWDRIQTGCPKRAAEGGLLGSQGKQCGSGLAKRKEMRVFDRIISRSPRKAGGAVMDTAGT